MNRVLSQQLMIDMVEAAHIEFGVIPTSTFPDCMDFFDVLQINQLNDIECVGPIKCIQSKYKTETLITYYIQIQSYSSKGQPYQAFVKITEYGGSFQLKRSDVYDYDNVKT